MTRVELELTADVRRTGRLAVAAASQDHPVETTSRTVIDVDLPLHEHPWTVGLITGPSGSGKSAVARYLWPGPMAAAEQLTWHDDLAVVDEFPDHMVASEVTGLLTRVGLGSVPAWLRPYRALSNGEAFRAAMARLIAEAGDADDGEPVVVDEFTSLVDRQVGRVVAHTTAKAARATGRPFVAVTCHHDVEEWLQPDWVCDVAAGSFVWRSVQPRPRIHLDVHRVPVAAWPLFRRHHYLSGEHHRAAVAFAAFADGVPVAWNSYIHFPHPRTKTIKMGHRLVVLPDWQGLGVAREFEAWLGQHLADQGLRYHTAVTHPAMKHIYASSPRWRLIQRSMRPALPNKRTSRAGDSLARHQRQVRQAGLASWEYVAPVTPGGGSTKEEISR